MTIVIQPYEWTSSDVDDEFTVRVYGYTRHQEDSPSRQVLLRINDYKPMARVELPTTRQGKKLYWTQDRANAYAKWVGNVLGDHRPVESTPKLLETLYGYNNRRKVPAIEFRFDTFDAMRHCRNLINKRAYPVPDLGLINATAHETKIPPIQTLLVEKNLGYGQWLKADASRVTGDERISRCDEEWETTVSAVRPLTAEQTRGWHTAPIVASIDIECYSHDHKRFPVKSFARDEIFQVSIISQRLFDATSRKKTLVVTGECHDIAGADVVRVENEVDAIDATVRVINGINPAIVTGYNIFNFDFPYMTERLNLRLRGWESCSVLKDDETRVRMSADGRGFEGMSRQSPLSAEGRIFLDMMLVVMKSHTLTRYSLEHVAHHFLGRGKHDVTPVQMFETFKARQDARKRGDEPALDKASQDMADVGAYCLEDSALCIDLMETLSTWIMLMELSTIVCVRPADLFTRGEQIRVLNQVYRDAYNRGILVDSREVSNEKVKGASVHEPVPGRYEHLLTFDFKSLYPTIIIAYNLCYTTIALGQDAPDEHCDVYEWTQDDGRTYRTRVIKRQYHHGILPRLCENLIRERNETRRKISPDNDPIENEVLQQRQLGLKICANSIYGSLGAVNGFLPHPEAFRTITATGREMIATAGEYVKNQYGGTLVYGDTDSIMVDLGLKDPLRCLQWGDALEKELTALYPKPHKMEFEAVYAIAMFTSKKRYSSIPLWTKRIGNHDTVVREPFADGYGRDDQVLYSITRGDDRDYVIVPRESSTHPNVPAIGDAITVDIVAGIHVKRGGVPDPKSVANKGNVLARRDNCQWLRDSYTNVLMSTLFRRPIAETIEHVNDAVLQMMTRHVPFEQLVVSQTMGGPYSAACTHPMKLFREELRKRGYDAKAGERLDFVFVKDARGRTKQGETRRILRHYHDNKDEEPIDLAHYVNNILANPVEQIFNLAYRDEIGAAMATRHVKRGAMVSGLHDKMVHAWVRRIRQKAKVQSDLCKADGDPKCAAAFRPK